MLTTKRIAIVASAVVVALGAATGQAQQPPRQAPDMTFFVTSAGLGKGADLGGLDGADRQCQALAQAASAAARLGGPILAPRPWMARPRSMLATASDAVLGRISKEQLSRKASTICTATAIT